MFPLRRFLSFVDVLFSKRLLEPVVVEQPLAVGIDGLSVRSDQRILMIVLPKAYGQHGKDDDCYDDHIVFGWDNEEASITKPHSLPLSRYAYDLLRIAVLFGDPFPPIKARTIIVTIRI